MAEQRAKLPTHGQVTNALRAALKTLRRDKSDVLPDTCADLWDDSLELVELLMEIEEELDAKIKCNAEFDWRAAPQRSATTTEFICWVRDEARNG